MTKVCLTLDDKLTHATFGQEYNELKQIMPDWARILHITGNVLSEDKLELIFTQGLLIWYIKQIVSNYGLSTSTSTSISFHDVLASFKLVETIKPDIINEIPKTLTRIANYKSFQDFNQKNGYKYESFNSYLTQHELLTETERLLNIHNNIVTSKIADIISLRETDIMIQLNQSKQLNIINDYLLQTILYTPIKHMGIVFQRWKIILEKLSKHYTNSQSDKNDKILYHIDDFLQKLQSIIYYHTKYVITCFIKYNISDFLQNFNVLPEFYEHKTYMYILFEINNNNSFLHQPLEINESKQQMTYESRIEQFELFYNKLIVS